jgi:hypothetical protein
VLGFHLAGDVKSIVGHMIDNMEKCREQDNPLHPNNAFFMQLESAIDRYAVGKALAR